MGSLPLLPTINLNIGTSSLLENTFRPPDVLLMVKGAPAGSWGCTLSGSNRTSKALIVARPVFNSCLGRVRVIVHPALFRSLFDAKHVYLHP